MAILGCSLIRLNLGCLLDFLGSSVIGLLLLNRTLWSLVLLLLLQGAARKNPRGASRRSRAGARTSSITPWIEALGGGGHGCIKSSMPAIACCLGVTQYPVDDIFVGCGISSRERFSIFWLLTAFWFFYGALRAFREHGPELLSRELRHLAMQLQNDKLLLMTSLVDNSQTNLSVKETPVRSNMIYCSLVTRRHGGAIVQLHRLSNFVWLITLGHT